MFLRTISELDEDTNCKRMLKDRSLECAQQREKAVLNENDSPIYDLLHTSVDIGLFEICMKMIQNDHYYTKKQRKDMVWGAIWEMEDNDCKIMYMEGKEVPMFFKVLVKPYYLLWWLIADQFPKMMGMCEKMAAIVTNSSKLKSDDVKLKSSSFWSQTCTRCDLGLVENAIHIVMQCPVYENERSDMYSELEMLQCDEINRALTDTQNICTLLLGRQPEYMTLENMFKVCTISGKHITKIYDNITLR